MAEPFDETQYIPEGADWAPPEWRLTPPPPEPTLDELAAAFAQQQQGALPPGEPEAPTSTLPGLGELQLGGMAQQLGTPPEAPGFNVPQPQISPETAGQFPQLGIPGLEVQPPLPQPGFEGLELQPPEPPAISQGPVAFPEFQQVGSVVYDAEGRPHAAVPQEDLAAAQAARAKFIEDQQRAQEAQSQLDRMGPEEAVRARVRAEAQDRIEGINRQTDQQLTAVDMKRQRTRPPKPGDAWNEKPLWQKALLVLSAGIEGWLNPGKPNETVRMIMDQINADMNTRMHLYNEEIDRLVKRENTLEGKRKIIVEASLQKYNEEMKRIDDVIAHAKPLAEQFQSPVARANAAVGLQGLLLAQQEKRQKQLLEMRKSEYDALDVEVRQKTQAANEREAQQKLGLGYAQLREQARAAKAGELLAGQRLTAETAEKERAALEKKQGLLVAEPLDVEREVGGAKQKVRISGASQPNGEPLVAKSEAWATKIGGLTAATDEIDGALWVLSHLADAKSQYFIANKTKRSQVTNQMVNFLIGKLREPLLGPGVMDVREQQRVRETIGEAERSIASLTDAEGGIAKIKNLRQIITNSATSAIRNGTIGGKTATEYVPDERIRDSYAGIVDEFRKGDESGRKVTIDEPGIRRQAMEEFLKAYGKSLPTTVRQDIQSHPPSPLVLGMTPGVSQEQVDAYTAAYNKHKEEFVRTAAEHVMLTGGATGGTAQQSLRDELDNLKAQRQDVLRGAEFDPVQLGTIEDAIKSVERQLKEGQQ